MSKRVKESRPGNPILTAQRMSHCETRLFPFSQPPSLPLSHSLPPPNFPPLLVFLNIYFPLRSKKGNFLSQLVLMNGKESVLV